jgi:hypothetical protein
MNSPLVAPAECSHNDCMSKPRVEFKYKRIAEDEWQIEAHFAGAEIRHIKGFTSKAEIDEWLKGSGRIDWLRSQGYVKMTLGALIISAASTAPASV